MKQDKAGIKALAFAHFQLKGTRIICGLLLQRIAFFMLFLL